MIHSRTAISLLVLTMMSCDSGAKAPSSPTLKLEPCKLGPTALAARCGTFEVFEDRAAGAGRTIALRVAVVPARTDDPLPDPLFILVGGPGQSATGAGAQLAMAFDRVRKRRDLVLVDQRGTGSSNPLRCSTNDQSLEKMFDPEFHPEDVRKCLAKHDAAPQHYTTPVAMDDLDDVRAALGYDQINLWGGSYGTRAALTYMRRHPKHTRRVVLDGPAPTDIKLTVHAGRDAQRALDLMFDRCAADESCAGQFGDVRATFSELNEALPQQVTIAHPRTGKPTTFALTRDGFAAIVRTILYVPEFVALLPISFEEAKNGNWSPLIAAFAELADTIGKDMADGMFLSVVCAEDVPQITAEERARLRDNFLGDEPLRLLLETCALWPSATLPAAYFEPITQPHPTLVLSGELDPVVPPTWGDLVASRLPNSVHAVIPGAAHGVSTLPCVLDAIVEFLDVVQPTSTEVDCSVDGTAPFVTSLGGSR